MSSAPSNGLRIVVVGGAPWIPAWAGVTGGASCVGGDDGYNSNSKKRKDKG